VNADRVPIALADPAVGRDAAQSDAAARGRIADALGDTLFVEAGAGSGKTRELVGRIVALVTTGTTGIDAIAAITFTEKAASELRDRVRRQLEGALERARGAADATVADRCARALDDLDGAAIGTLHSFAQRLLAEHPIEAGLPPRIEVLDEVASTVAFDDRWAGFLDQLLANDAIERPLLLATAAGVRLNALRVVALGFNDNWDLAETQAPSEPVEPPEWTPRLDALMGELAGACDERHHADDDDTLHERLCQLEEWADRVRAASDEFTKLGLLGSDSRPNGRGRGAKARWPDDYDLGGLRERIDRVRAGCDELRTEVALAAVLRLAVDLRRFTLDAAAERRKAGQLEFHDLLVLARQMLRGPHAGVVRAALHRRYRHLLIDEFQDTDPIQIELAVLIAGLDPGERDAPWERVEVRPGHLFFVGDPKQSIYRFRRADISLFLRAADRFGRDGGQLRLTTNYRSTRSIIAVVNHVFGQLIQPQGHGGVRSQPAYEPLVAVRDDAPVGPAVSVLGRRQHGEDAPEPEPTDTADAGAPAPRAPRLYAEDVRRLESAEVAATIRRALDEGWLVDRSPDANRHDWQPARAGDVAILVPTRLSLPALEDALTVAGISYRAESASLVYASRLVRDLLLTLRAIDDPSDELSVVAALRSPMFGCGDDDLFRFRHEHGGRFDHSAGLPETVPDGDPVACGLAYLHRMHDLRTWRSPSELADAVVRDRRLLELGPAEGRPRDLWRRVRFVLDQSRAWTDATNGSLRQYLEWVRQQTAEGSRVAEAVLPETDDDAVRIMTVHAAKGLQFPITIVAGLSTRPQRRSLGAEVAWPPEGQAIIRIGNKVRSAAFEAWLPIDEQMSHDERIRLLYVACTRARDHLVVSLHRAVRGTVPDDHARFTSAELLTMALDQLLDGLPDGAPPQQVVAAEARDVPDVPGDAPLAGGPPPAGRLPTFDDWRRIRDEALATSGRPRTLAATALTDDGRPDALDDPGLHKRPRDLDLPPWQKGRYGTAIGRAVHGVLQTIDLASGGGIAEAVAAQAAAEGVSGHEAHIRRLVEAALRSPSVVAAAAAPPWREVYVGVPVGDDRTLEGYVDLLYRRPGGLVVVDYKTGPHGVDADLDPLVERYRMQGASYALAVAGATREPVLDMVFVFLTPEGAVERSIPDLAEAVAEARRLAAAADPRLVAT
jgi:ATP-dependent exoDNAse (exonuclease V) beta subunit